MCSNMVAVEISSCVSFFLQLSSSLCFSVCPVWWCWSSSLSCAALFNVMLGFHYVPFMAVNGLVCVHAVACSFLGCSMSVFDCKIPFLGVSWLQGWQRTVFTEHEQVFKYPEQAFELATNIAPIVTRRTDNNPSILRYWQHAHSFDTCCPRMMLPHGRKDYHTNLMLSA
jgi:hypothetical protein